jgi:hypothetical protein
VCIKLKVKCCEWEGKKFYNTMNFTYSIVPIIFATSRREREAKILYEQDPSCDAYSLRWATIGFIRVKHKGRKVFLIALKLPSPWSAPFLSLSPFLLCGHKKVTHKAKEEEEERERENYDSERTREINLFTLSDLKVTTLHCRKVQDSGFKCS